MEYTSLSNIGNYLRFHTPHVHYVTLFCRLKMVLREFFTCMRKKSFDVLSYDDPQSHKMMCTTYEVSLRQQPIMHDQSPQRINNFYRDRIFRHNIAHVNIEHVLEFWVT